MELKTKFKKNYLIITPQIDSLDYENSEDLHEFFDEKIEEEIINFILDMQKIAYIDSSGLSSLFTIYKKLSEISGLLAIANPSKAVQHILDVTHMSDTLMVCDNIKTAEKHIKKEST